MTRCNKLIEKFNEASVNDFGEVPKVTMAVIEKLGKNEFFQDNDSQKDMVNELAKLAEMDDDGANAFMKKVDEACTAIHEKFFKKNKK